MRVGRLEFEPYEGSQFWKADTAAGRLVTLYQTPSGAWVMDDYMGLRCRPASTADQALRDFVAENVRALQERIYALEAML